MAHLPLKSVYQGMKNPLRLTIAFVALMSSAACSGSPEQPVLSDDLTQDLARAGGSDVQLAGASAPRLDVVSASERMESPALTPEAKTVSRAPSAARGRTAIVRSVRRETPAVAQPQVSAVESAPAEERVEEAVPEPSPASAGRPRAPQPSTQREPPGGWSSPSTIIRNAPFPINP